MGIVTDWEAAVEFRQNLRLTLLKQIYDNYYTSGNGTTIYRMKLDTKSKLACQYLAEKGFIRLENCGGLQPSFKRNITAGGIDYLEASKSTVAGLENKKPGACQLV